MEVSRLMQYRRILREVTIPAFERIWDISHGVTEGAIEQWSEFSPSVDLDLFTWASDEMYLDLHTVVRSKWALLHDQIETIEERVRQLTGKSPDELDAIELEFWEECNTAGLE